MCLTWFAIAAWVADMVVIAVASKRGDGNYNWQQPRPQQVATISQAHPRHMACRLDLSLEVMFAHWQRNTPYASPRADAALDEDDDFDDEMLSRMLS
jgi:hypothetical protein